MQEPNVVSFFQRYEHHRILSSKNTKPVLEKSAYAGWNFIKEKIFLSQNQISLIICITKIISKLLLLFLQEPTIMLTE